MLFTGVMFGIMCVFFFFKQKTAYEMRISDWSSDVCSSDLTTLEFKSIVRRLRAVRPDMTLSSDFIVGFPGETEAVFQKTLDLIRHVGFDQSFSFVDRKSVV